MKKRLSLRIKITLLFILVSSFMCLSLTLATFYNANSWVQSVELNPSSSMLQESTNVIPATLITATATATAKKTFQINTIYVMMGIIIIGAIITYYLAGKALKPLEDLTKSVANRTVETLSQDLPSVTKSEEVFKLTEAFNQMSKDISNSYQAQKNFSANAAHELRTPLAVLQTKLDVFNMQGGHSQEEYDLLIGSVGESTDRSEERRVGKEC